MRTKLSGFFAVAALAAAMATTASASDLCAGVTDVTMIAAQGGSTGMHEVLAQITQILLELVAFILLALELGALIVRVARRCGLFAKAMPSKGNETPFPWTCQFCPMKGLSQNLAQPVRPPAHPSNGDLE